MKKRAPIRRAKPSEDGYMLVAVIFLLALLTIALAVALPIVSKEIQRDREQETMQRGKQYIRAVRMYYKTFNRYPPNADALLKPTNNIRFLRKKYADPTTGKEDWKPVLLGQNKAPTAMGFFGQPLGGSMGAGAGLSGAGLNTSNGMPDANGQQSASGQQPADPNNPNAASNGTNPNSTATGLSGQAGQTFGGAGIIGFSPNSPKQSIMVYKKKNHYNEWEFVYDPMVEQMMMQGAGATGLPASGTGTGSGSGSSGSNGNNTGTGTGFGSTFSGGSGSSFGGSGSGSSFGGTTPTPQPPPPQ
jgi:type II secretory pathway pseudopilin PulG